MNNNHPTKIGCFNGILFCLSMVTKVHLLAIVYTRRKFPTEVTPFQKGVTSHINPQNTKCDLKSESTEWFEV